MKTIEELIDIYLEKSESVGEVTNRPFFFGEIKGGEGKKMTFYGLPPKNDKDPNHTYVIGTPVIRDTIINTDLLYIDTLNTSRIKELELKHYSPEVNKYILIRGSHKYRDHDQIGDGVGIKSSIEYFVKNTEWEIIDETSDDTGLIVLGKEVKQPIKKGRKKAAPKDGN